MKKSISSLTIIISPKSSSSNNTMMIQKRNLSTVTTTTTDQQSFRVAIIGTGVAGLSTLEALTRHGKNSKKPISITAFEKSSNIGGVWFNRYKGLSLQVTQDLYEFPQKNKLYPTTAQKIPSGTDVLAMIENFATEKNDIKSKIQFNSQVTNLKPIMSTGKSETKWTLDVTQKKNGSSSKTSQEFDYVIVCCGLFNQPNLSLFQDKTLQRDGNNPLPIITTTEFKDPSQVQNKNVVVIGAGKSAHDVALEAKRSGADKVTLLFRQAHWGVPLNILNLIPFHWIFLSRFGQTLVELGMGPWPTTSYDKNPRNSMRKAHLILRPVMSPVFKLVQTLFKYQLGHNQGDRLPETDLVSDLYGYAAIYTGDYKKATGIQNIKGKLTWMDGKNKKIGYTVGGESNKNTITTVKEIPCDLVISAIGFFPQYHVLFSSEALSKLDVEYDGLWLARGMFPVQFNHLAFVGSALSVSNITTSAIQAEYVARVVMKQAEGKNTNSSEEGIWSNSSKKQEEIDIMKQWKRKEMPNTPTRAHQVLLHMTSYHDTLLRDMGEQPTRKSNPISEVLLPYGPGDYGGIFK
jgi:dimethylaniline monooxygenase (N-oxide forming)